MFAQSPNASVPRVVKCLFFAPKWKIKQFLLPLLFIMMEKSGIFSFWLKGLSPLIFLGSPIKRKCTAVSPSAPHLTTLVLVAAFPLPTYCILEISMPRPWTGTTQVIKSRSSTLTSHCHPGFRSTLWFSGHLLGYTAYCHKIFAERSYGSWISLIVFPRGFIGWLSKSW